MSYSSQPSDLPLPGTQPEANRLGRIAGVTFQHPRAITAAECVLHVEFRSRSGHIAPFAPPTARWLNVNIHITRLQNTHPGGVRVIHQPRRRSVGLCLPRGCALLPFPTRWLRPLLALGHQPARGGARLLVGVGLVVAALASLLIEGELKPVPPSVRLLHLTTGRAAVAAPSRIRLRQWARGGCSANRHPNR